MHPTRTNLGVTPPNCRKRTTKSQVSDDMSAKRLQLMEEALNKLNNEEQEDGPAAFGRVVAESLRGMTAYQADYARMKIQELLFQVKHQGCDRTHSTPESSQSASQGQWYNEHQSFTTLLNS